MQKINLKLNEDYRITWLQSEDGSPGLTPIITVLCGDYEGLSFILESSWISSRSDEIDNNNFTYNYKFLSLSNNIKDKLSKEDEQYMFQLILNYIDEYKKYGRYHTIWLKYDEKSN